MKTSPTRATCWMQGLCGALAVLYLVLRFSAPMTEFRPQEPAPNGQSVAAHLHQPRHAALIPVEPHWLPAVRTVRSLAPEGYRQVAKPEGPAHGGGLLSWVIPLRV